MGTELKTILMIDDDEDIRFIAQMSLQDVGGYTVELCECGSKGVEKAREIVPDVILLDVMMPEMDGPTTFQKLKEIPALADVPIIFMTAKSQIHEQDKLMDIGAAAVITKPFDPITLPVEVRDIWKRH